jgi:hypothetical protein
MRTIRESQRYTEQCQELGDIKRLDEVLVGVCWAVVSDPEHFDLVPQTDIRWFPVDEISGIPALRIYFRVADDEYIDFLRIERIEDDPDEPVL